MIKTEESLVQIKKTKSVEMFANSNEIWIKSLREGYMADMVIPMKVVFQVHRGLTSYIARFYRLKKHDI